MWANTDLIRIWSSWNRFCVTMLKFKPTHMNEETQQKQLVRRTWFRNLCGVWPWRTQRHTAKPPSADLWNPPIQILDFVIKTIKTGARRETAESSSCLVSVLLVSSITVFTSAHSHWPEQSCYFLPKTQQETLRAEVEHRSSLVISNIATLH